MFIDKPMLVFSHKSGWTSWLFWVLRGSWALFLFASPTIRLLLHSSSVLFFSHRPPPSDPAACVLSSFSHVWLFVTPWIAACQARTLEWIAMPSGNLSNLGIEPESPASQADSLTLGHRGSPQTLGFLNLPVLVPDFAGSALICHSYSPPISWLHVEMRRPALSHLLLAPSPPTHSEEVPL